MALTLIVASLGSGLSGQAGAARVLFGMGRDNVLPRKMFGYIDPNRQVPTWNLWTIGVIAFLGAMFLDFERAAELLNFGAFLAFMGVNLAVIKQFYFTNRPGKRRNWFKDVLLPALGFIFCFWIWWSLPRPAKVVGGIWFVLGISYLAVMTQGFRRKPESIEFSDS